MTFMDKLTFWKKKEDTFAALDKQLGALGPSPPGQMPATPGTEGEHPLGLETGYGEPFGDELSRTGATGMEYEQQYEQPAEEGLAPFTMEHPGEERRKADVPQQYGQPLQPIEQHGQINHNMQQQLELVTAKLDTIRVSLESINHRLAALERTLHVPEYEEEQPVPRRRRGVW